MEMSRKINLGVQLMAYGLAGVFSVLILFYIITKAMVKIAQKYCRHD